MTNLEHLRGDVAGIRQVIHDAEKALSPHRPAPTRQDLTNSLFLDIFYRFANALDHYTDDENPDQPPGSRMSGIPKTQEAHP